jgi:hypothetical protein
MACRGDVARYAMMENFSLDICFKLHIFNIGQEEWTESFSEPSFIVALKDTLDSFIDDLVLGY